MAIVRLYERMSEALESRDGSAEGCLPGPDELGAGSGIVVITAGRPR